MPNSDTIPMDLFTEALAVLYAADIVLRAMAQVPNLSPSTIAETAGKIRREADALAAKARAR